MKTKITFVLLLLLFMMGGSAFAQVQINAPTSYQPVSLSQGGAPGTYKVDIVNNNAAALFNLQFYRSLSFLEGTNNFILFDESKTRTEILKELKAFFDNKLDSNTIKKSLLPPNVSYRKFQEYYKAMYFLM